MSEKDNGFLSRFWWIIPLFVDAISVIVLRNYPILEKEIFLLGPESKGLTPKVWMLFILGWAFVLIFDHFLNRLLRGRLFGPSSERISSFFIAYYHAFILVYSITTRPTVGDIIFGFIVNSWSYDYYFIFIVPLILIVKKIIKTVKGKISNAQKN